MMKDDFYCRLMWIPVSDRLQEELKKHHDFYVNAYRGFENLPRNDKSRVDEITPRLQAFAILQQIKADKEHEVDIITRRVNK